MAHENYGDPCDPISPDNTACMGCIRLYIKRLEAQLDGAKAYIPDGVEFAPEGTVQSLRGRLAEETRSHDEVSGQMARKMAEMSATIAGLVGDCHAAENRIQVAAQKHLVLLASAQKDTERLSFALTQCLMLDYSDHCIQTRKHFDIYRAAREEVK